VRRDVGRSDANQERSQNRPAAIQRLSLTKLSAPPPWTIPANMGIAYHPTFEYVAADVNGEVYIVALELLNATASKATI
jgi:tRNA synthetases class I (I, L, M and V)